MRWLCCLALAACAPPPAPAAFPLDETPQLSEAELRKARRDAACLGPIHRPPRPVLIEVTTITEGFVGRVEISGNERVSEQRVLELIDTRDGGALDREQLAADVSELWSLGEFEDVAVLARGAADDLTVIFEVREHPVIGAMFVLNCETCVLAAISGPFSYELTRSIKRQLTDELVHDGYREARVDVRRRRPKPGVVDVCVDVERGPKAASSERTAPTAAR
jgi:outer membrane protein assembly factor BamA